MVVGVPFYGSPADGQFAKVWQIFMRLGAGVAQTKTPPVYFGVETYTEEFQQEQKWFYLAGVEVASLAAIPIQLVAKVIPAARYAVFEHRGVLPGNLSETFQYAYRTWLPQSGYVSAAPYDLERYGEKFLGPQNPESVTEILIPIKSA